MLKKLLIALPVLLSVVSLRGYSQTQNPNSSVNRTSAIDGSIILPTNQPMERYEILLLSKDGEQVISRTYTDLSGRYHFANLTADAVDVVVRIEGFDEARVPVKLSPGRIASVNMILTEKARTVVEPGALDSSV